MVVIGAQGHAKEVLNVFLEKEIKLSLMFFDNINKTENDLFYGFSIINDFDKLEEILKQDPRFYLAIGGTIQKQILTQRIISYGGNLESVISNKAYLSEYVQYGKGVNIMPFSSIFGNAIIGEGVLINSYASVHHDCKVGNYTELSPGCRILGNCSIGRNVSIGANAVILPEIKIGDKVRIGAGAVVTKDILESGTYVGIPARRLKK